MWSHSLARGCGIQLHAIIDGRTGGTVAPQTKIWEEEPPPPPTHTHTHTRILVPKNTYRWIWHWWILPVSSTTLELFCPKMTWEAPWWPKKHHEAGLPEQAWNNCLRMHCHKSITDTLDTACEDWREVWLCQLKLPKVFWKIWGGISAWWKVSPPAFQKCPFNRGNRHWTKIIWTFFQDQILCPLNGGVP